MRGRALCDAATANFVVHASWAASRNPGARVESTASLTIVDSGLRTDTFNVVCGARLRGDEVSAIARRVAEHFRAVDRPFSWWVAPGDEPNDLAERLTDAGLERQETELAMALELSTLASGPAAPKGVEVREARSDMDIAAFARINAENWQPPDAAVEAFYLASTPTLLGGDSPQKVFIALRDGEPVAALELTLAAGVGGIYNLSTRAAHRRRGIGGALLERACRRSSELGARTVVLQASAAGASLYRSFGFREFGLIEELKPSHS
jgi:ribosomal protein S18 acetylase RimI-like enzyme